MPFLQTYEGQKLLQVALSVVRENWGTPPIKVWDRNQILTIRIEVVGTPTFSLSMVDLSPNILVYFRYGDKMYSLMGSSKKEIVSWVQSILNGFDQLS